VPANYKNKAKIKVSQQLTRKQELNETVDDFFAKNKLYLKTARDHEVNNAGSRREDVQAMNVGIGTANRRKLMKADTMDSVDYSKMDNDVVYEV